MCQLLPNVHTHHLLSEIWIDIIEAFIHQTFGTKGFDDAQPTQSFLHHAHRVAPQPLRLNALRFELSSHKAHKPTKNRNKDDGENGELPRGNHQGNEIAND